MELQKINEFLASKKFAMIGVSRDTKKTGYVFYKELKKKLYNIVPVNPHIDEIDGNPCYPTISSLPSDVEALIFTTKPEVTNQLLAEAFHKGIKQIFLQLGSSNDKTIELIAKTDINIIYKRCILMFAKPEGFHKFHAFVAKLFRNYPG